MKPYFQDEFVTLYHADYRDVLTRGNDALVADAIITDPPYGETSRRASWPR